MHEVKEKMKEFQQKFKDADKKVKHMEKVDEVFLAKQLKEAKPSQLIDIAQAKDKEELTRLRNEREQARRQMWRLARKNLKQIINSAKINGLLTPEEQTQMLADWNLRTVQVNEDEEVDLPVPEEIKKQLAERAKKK